MKVYEEKDIDVVLVFLNSLTLTGIEGARRLSTAATILENGIPLDEYRKEEKEDGGV